MKGSLGQDENFFIKGENAMHPQVVMSGVARREPATSRSHLFGTGAVWKDLGGNVGQVVAVGDKPLLASKEGQHTVYPLTVNEKPVVGAGWRRNGEGARSEIVGGEGGNCLGCKGVRSRGRLALGCQHCGQVVSKGSAAGLLREIRHLGDRGATRHRQDSGQAYSPRAVGRGSQPPYVTQIGHGEGV
jgi:hypothetical protein